MTSTATAASTGSRTAAYACAGVVATAPVWGLLLMLLGPDLATGATAVGWTSGVAWLLKKRQDDPSWDRRPVVRRR